MYGRNNLLAGIALLLAICFTGQLNAQTPFSFIHRDDVREEINVSQTQINRVDQLQVHCDTLCQQRMREAVRSMDTDLQQQFEQLDIDQRQNALATLEEDIQETVELEALDDQVLNDPQMDRFEQLWTQRNGLDSLTCGPSCRQLGISDIQISQIQNIRNGASGAMEACIQDQQLSPQQQFNQIQNIQINLINQCVNVLSDEQTQQFADMCGEPFNPNPAIDDTATDDSSIDAEMQDSDATTMVEQTAPNSTGRRGLAVPVNGRR